MTKEEKKQILISWICDLDEASLDAMLNEYCDISNSHVEDDNEDNE